VNSRHGWPWLGASQRIAADPDRYRLPIRATYLTKASPPGDVTINSIKAGKGVTFSGIIGFLLNETSCRLQHAAARFSRELLQDLSNSRDFSNDLRLLDNFPATGKIMLTILMMNSYLVISYIA